MGRGVRERVRRVTHAHGAGETGLAKLIRMGEATSLRRFAIVQPSYYGTNNRCMLDALNKLGARGRGVAMVEDSISDDDRSDG